MKGLGVILDKDPVGAAWTWRVGRAWTLTGDDGRIEVVAPTGPMARCITMSRDYPLQEVALVPDGKRLVGRVAKGEHLRMQVLVSNMTPAPGVHAYIQPGDGQGEMLLALGGGNTTPAPVAGQTVSLGNPSGCMLVLTSDRSGLVECNLPRASVYHIRLQSSLGEDLEAIEWRPPDGEVSVVLPDSYVVEFHVQAPGDSEAAAGGASPLRGYFILPPDGNGRIRPFRGSGALVPSTNLMLPFQGGAYTLGVPEFHFLVDDERFETWKSPLEAAIVGGTVHVPVVLAARKDRRTLRFTVNVNPGGHGLTAVGQFRHPIDQNQTRLAELRQAGPLTAADNAEAIMSVMASRWDCGRLYIIERETGRMGFVPRSEVESAIQGSCPRVDLGGGGIRIVCSAPECSLSTVRMTTQDGRSTSGPVVGGAGTYIWTTLVDGESQCSSPETVICGVPPGSYVLTSRMKGRGADEEVTSRIVVHEGQVLEVELK